MTPLADDGALRGVARRVRQSVRAIQRRFDRRGGLILLYHRISELDADPQQLSVSPDHFADHLDVLSRNTRPVPLGNLQGATASGTGPPPVAVTFDDGYADNLGQASPLLERFGVPATVFVTTGYVDSGREFWWDELERLLLLPGTLPRDFLLKIGATERRWNVDGVSEYSEDEVRRNSAWTVEQDADPTPRHVMYRALCGLLRPLPSAEREKVLDGLARQADVTRTGRQTHLALDSEALVRLAAQPQVQVGAHAQTHGVLSGLPVAAQSAEIFGSKARLEEWAGRPVTSFAYPFGGRGDYSPTTVGLVRDAGFALACANVPDVVDPGTNPFELPRLLVRDWDGDVFLRHLKAWIDV